MYFAWETSIKCLVQDEAKIKLLYFFEPLTFHFVCFDLVNSIFLTCFTASKTTRNIKGISQFKFVNSSLSQIRSNYECELSILNFYLKESGLGANDCITFSKYIFWYCNTKVAIFSVQSYVGFFQNFDRLCWRPLFYFEGIFLHAKQMK